MLSGHVDGPQGAHTVLANDGLLLTTNQPSKEPGPAHGPRWATKSLLAPRPVIVQRRGGCTTHKGAARPETALHLLCLSRDKELETMGWGSVGKPVEPASVRGPVFAQSVLHCDWLNHPTHPTQPLAEPLNPSSTAIGSIAQLVHHSDWLNRPNPTSISTS